MQYYQAFISAEQTAQAYRILDALIAKQLVFGGPVVGGPAKFLWNFRDSDVSASLRKSKLYTLDQDYKYIITYTREDLKDELIEVAEAASLEEVCMISFLPMETNRSLRLLLDASFEGRDAHARPETVDAVAALTFVPKAQIPTRTKSSDGPVGGRR
ncbi:MAG: hypothetical protein KJ731_19280 [Alphaproteobacteria bacterium]|nr:hypothetical protein [Alphaproteobacteria bacterium]MBU1278888.1 hypothetical protein [Alphaproteobacteria bacterium]MBU1575467.1 hypothetical protein [Alphaproteobacteria bacterium]MBU1830592.1 hypothetical protein [Alphaproteobacteria bacterium]MBU2077488.1 hypothetical protein [Alphaproteobacteria bacterium]